MKSFIADRFKTRSYSMGNKSFSKDCPYTTINLGIGDLDVYTVEELIIKIMAYAKNGHTHYTNSYGYLELRQEICKYHSKNFENYDFTPENVNFENYDFTPENVMVVSGACHGLYLLFKSILNPDDEVILLAPFFPVYADQINLSNGKPVIVETKFENGGLYLLFKSILNPDDEVILLAPFFPVYADQINLSNGKPVIVETKFENGFQLVMEDLEKVVTSKTKAIVVNSPSNPKSNSCKLSFKSNRSLLQ